MTSNFKVLVLVSLKDKAYEKGNRGSINSLVCAVDIVGHIMVFEVVEAQSVSRILLSDI